MKLFKKKYIEAEGTIKYSLFGCINWYVKANHREIGRIMRDAWANAERGHLEEFRGSEVVRQLRTGDLCLDCGANVGDISAVFLDRGAEVHAFEPNPVAFQQLTNRFKGQNVKLQNVGVFKEKGTMKLFLSRFADVDATFFSQSSSIYATKDNVNVDSFVEVDLIDLSEYIQKLGRRVRVLKIDIEGAEFAVLDKMLNEGTYRLCDHILVETHDDGSIPEIMDLAREVRRRIKELDARNINLDWI